MNATEQSRLISDCIAGNEAAIEMLVRQHETGVFKLALSILGDETEANEVTQETFISALKSLHRYQEKSSLKAWLYTIALNLSRSSLRKRKVLERLRSTIGGILRIESQKRPSPEDEVVRTESEALVWSELNKLNERYRFRADDALSTGNQAKLNAHLNECPECSAYSNGYSNGFENTVSLLKVTMRKEWSSPPLPLQMDALYEKVYSRKGVIAFLATRTTLIGAVFLLFTFFVWQSIIPKLTSQQYPSGTTPLIPTPSMQYIVTNTFLNECQNIQYIIQPDDTLEGIARQFSVSAESILLANNLTDTSLTSRREIIIPICETTPTRTTIPPTFTITPILEPVVTTPG